MPNWTQALASGPMLDAELKLLGLLLVFLVARFVLLSVGGQLARRLDRVVTDAERRERLQTMLRVGRDGAIVLVLIAVIADGLGTLGLDVGVFLASLGVAGLLFSVGAQTVIRDYLGGILIIAEDQFRVGEVIEAAGKRGTVERVTLRVTYLRDESGHLHLLSNGELRVLSNFSRRA